jgi:hypothetical protein
MHTDGYTETTEQLESQLLGTSSPSRSSAVLSDEVVLLFISYKDKVQAHSIIIKVIIFCHSCGGAFFFNINSNVI